MPCIGQQCTMLRCNCSIGGARFRIWGRLIFRLIIGSHRFASFGFFCGTFLTLVCSSITRSLDFKVYQFIKKEKMVICERISWSVMRYAAKTELRCVKLNQLKLSFVILQENLWCMDKQIQWNPKLKYSVVNIWITKIYRALIWDGFSKKKNQVLLLLIDNFVLDRRVPFGMCWARTHFYTCVGALCNETSWACYIGGNFNFNP